ncbi:unnamed protein product, partial [marine sediment metagenome]
CGEISHQDGSRHQIFPQPKARAERTGGDLAVSGYTGELTRHPLDKLIRVVSGGFPNLASWDKPG